MTLGAEPKKVALLSGLLVLIGYLFYTNFLSTPGSEAPSASSGRGSAAPSIAQTLRNAVQPQSQTPSAAPASPQRNRRAPTSDFKPSLRPRRAEDRLDPTAVDPTLRLDLLAKLESVKIESVDRSLFDFSAAPPKQAEPKIEVQAAKVKKMVGPEPPPPPPPPPVEPPKPVAPPVPLKFYGYQIGKDPSGRRTFCMDGEEILTPLEGDTIKNRYKIVRIGLTNVVVEDLQFKSQQTVPIEETSPGV